MLKLNQALKTSFGWNSYAYPVLVTLISFFCWFDFSRFFILYVLHYNCTFILVFLISFYFKLFRSFWLMCEIKLTACLPVFKSKFNIISYVRSQIVTDTNWQLGRCNARTQSWSALWCYVGHRMNDTEAWCCLKSKKGLGRQAAH